MSVIDQTAAVRVETQRACLSVSLSRYTRLLQQRSVALFAGEAMELQVSFRGKPLTVTGVDHATAVEHLKTKLEELTAVPVANQKLVRATGEHHVLWRHASSMFSPQHVTD